VAIRPGAATVKLADADSRAPAQPRNFAGSGPGPALAVVPGVPVDLSAVDTLQAAMTYHRERHTVLAGNVANLDTPGYRPMDLQRRTAEDPVAMTVTHEGQIATQTDSDYVTSYDDGGALQGSDGNAVTLEREMSKIDANRARYATSAELVSRRLAMLRYAAGDGT
jgi:flagellar basal-body rod protein FlgB